MHEKAAEAAIRKGNRYLDRRNSDLPICLAIRRSDCRAIERYLEHLQLTNSKKPRKKKRALQEDPIHFRRVQPALIPRKMNRPVSHPEDRMQTSVRAC